MIVVATLAVHAQEAVEDHAAAVRAQDVLPRLDIEPCVLETRRGHLRGEHALPDERVQLQLIGLEIPLEVPRRARQVGRADRLVRLLRALRPRLVMPRMLERVFRSELARHDVLRLTERALGDVQRVGSHIGDEADRRVAERDALVELLRDDHRPAHGEAELARGLLLQRRGGERRRGIASALARLETLHDVRGLLERGAVLLGRLAVGDLELLALELDDLGRERLAGHVREERLDAPVLLRGERLDLALAVDDQAQRDGLNSAGGESVADLLPEERRHRVTDQPVDDATRLLGVHQILVDVARMLERVLDRRRRDLVERHAAELRRRDLDDVGDVPSDGLTLAVEVSRKPDVGGRLGLPPEEAHLLLRVVRDDVLRQERLEVDAHLRLR